MTAALHLGDCVEVMRSFPASSVDSVITDPPYELNFMGKGWDASGIANSVELWREALRVAKPGAILLAFGGSRTYHRMTCAIEDAGWEIRDCIMWIYGSGFPKSLDISKAIDKAAGAEREVVGFSKQQQQRTPGVGTAAFGDYCGQSGAITAPSTPLAQLWSGWGTSLKPSHEPICVAMKPLDGTFAANAERWGVAGLNVDGGRVGLGGTENMAATQAPSKSTFSAGATDWTTPTYKPSGRWPANLIHDGSEEVVKGFPVTKTGRVASHSERGMFGSGRDVDYADTETGGSAARFFYTAKASRSEREAGCEGLAEPGGSVRADGGAQHVGETRLARNHHPTVKPLALMRYLAKLTKTPTGGTVLDPFMGSGTTGAACVLEGRDFIGIEREAEYLEIARRRIAHWEGNPIHEPAPDAEPPPLDRQRSIWELT